MGLGACCLILAAVPRKYNAFSPLAFGPLHMFCDPRYLFKCAHGVVSPPIAICTDFGQVEPLLFLHASNKSSPFMKSLFPQYQHSGANLATAVGTGVEPHRATQRLCSSVVTMGSHFFPWQCDETCKQ